MKNKFYLRALPVLMLFVFYGCKKDKEETPAPTPTPNYSNLKILSVKVTAMSFLDGAGAGWDPLDGPEVFFNIKDPNGNIEIDGSGSAINNAVSSGLPFSWSLINALQITNISVPHIVSIYDYDSFDPDDLIGEISFTLSDHKSGYPTTISKSSGDLTIVITGEWY